MFIQNSEIVVKHDVQIHGTVDVEAWPLSQFSETTERNELTGLFFKSCCGRGRAG